MDKTTLKLLWLYIFPVSCLIAGIALGCLGSDLVAAFFIASIALSFILAVFFAIKGYRAAPRQSEAYVTWGAFVSTLLGLYMPLIAALIWIAFELGKVSG